MPPLSEVECVSRLGKILSAEQAALRGQLDRLLEERFTQIARQVGAELEAMLARAQAPAPQPEAALPLEEQRLHLAAQRFARVEVARLRLEHAEAVGRGRRQGNLYQELRAEIDAARRTFQRDYLAACPSMKDYLHLEVVSNLAQNDTAQLGGDYPGPLV